MKREKRFRAWNKKRNIMVYFMHPEFKLDPFNVKCAFSSDLCMTNSEVMSELMDWVGLTDQKGDDIYEDDVCNYEYYIQTSQDPDSYQVFKGVGIIEFIDGAYMIKDLKTEQVVPLHYGDLTLTVLGNNHETPNLI